MGKHNDAVTNGDGQGEPEGDGVSALTSLIKDYCEAEGATAPDRAATRIASFAVDLVIRYHFERLRECDERHGHAASQTIARRIGLARTIRRKLSRLYGES
jgi:hypothetical protein